MADRPAQHAADRPRVEAVAALRHLIWPEAHGRLRRAEERLGRLHVARLAEHGVDQVAVPVDRPIQVGPAAADLQVGLVDVPAGAGAASQAVPELAQFVADDGKQLRFPGPGGFMADLDPAQCQDLAQVTQRQPAEHHEGDDVAGQAGPVQHTGAALVELPPAGLATEPVIAASRDLEPLGHQARATVNAVHPVRPVVHPLPQAYLRRPTAARLRPGAMQDSAFGMRPDATVLTPDVRALLIADAKWKQLDRSTANIGVSRNDIYQMAAYAACYRCPNLALVYPLDPAGAPGLVDMFTLPEMLGTRVTIYALNVAALAHGHQLPERLRPIAISVLPSAQDHVQAEAL